MSDDDQPFLPGGQVPRPSHIGPEALLSAFIQAKGIKAVNRALGWRGRLRRRIAVALRRLATVIDGPMVVRLNFARMDADDLARIRAELGRDP